MLWKAGYGARRSRWHYASRVIFSLGGRGDNRVQVCDGLAPAQSCTPLFLYKCAGICARANGAEGVRESVAVDAVAATDTVSQRRVAIEVAGLAVWAAALPLNKLTDEQVPLSLSASVRVERWNRAPSALCTITLLPSPGLRRCCRFRECPETSSPGCGRWLLR